jgi:hypothetical protein
MRALLCASLLLAAASAVGQVVERETFSVLGWNDACSVAVQQLGYPVLGEAIQDEPVLTRAGTITIPPGEDNAQTFWDLDWKGARTWKAADAKKVLQGLAASGYTRPGFQEDILLPRKEAPHSFETTILSTETFGLRADFPWPGGDWRWEQVRYSSLGDCGLFIFRKGEDGRSFYRYFLLRLYNPSVLAQRAQAHLTNSRLLFDSSELEPALAEATTAASMRPELAAARYRHAALLCLTGHLNESVSELGAAIRLDAKLAETARTDPDFYEVYEFPRFRRLVDDKTDRTAGDDLH